MADLFLSTRLQIVCVVRLQVAYSYTYELRPYLDLLLQILLIEDSWQTHRSDSLLCGSINSAVCFDWDLNMTFLRLVV